MKRVPFKMFNEIRMVPHITYTNADKDNPPKDKWGATLWVERGEDWYGLDYYKRKGITVLVVEREGWLRSPLAMTGAGL